MPEASPTVLIFETTAGDPPVEFLGDSSDIVYFISMAHSERYGADHPLAKAASAIKRRLRLPMGPLLNFGDAAPDNAAEQELLEHLWQDAAALAECARSVATAIESDEEVREMTAALPELPERLRELAAMAEWAAEHGAQVRLTFVL
ncbi:MAG TPA: hypothetical protein VIW01_09940 [Dehalococcoidia bacterium]